MKFTTEAFSGMEGLQLFKVYWSCGFTNLTGGKCTKLLVPEDFEFPSYDLRYLHWERYPLESLPSNFDGENLVELNLMNSNIKRLWQIEKRREKLKVLNLSNSRELTDMPCFSNMPNLEKVNIESCGSLKMVDPSIGDLNNLTSLVLSTCQKIEELPITIQDLVSLQSLKLQCCENLRSLPSSICKLKSLEYMDVSCCSKLKTFPKISENMECLNRLDLSKTGIKELPESIIEYLKNLTYLNMGGCRNLESLPVNICRLKYLEGLDLSKCSSLKSFPEITERMERLKGLDLFGSGIRGLPSSLTRFINRFCDLTLMGCRDLRILPSNICKFEFYDGELDLSNCLSLELFPEITGDMECLEDIDLNRSCINDLTRLTLEGCENLRSLPSSICRLKSLKSLILMGCSKLESFPEIMEDMEYLEKLDLSRTGIKELPSSIENLRSLTSLVLSHCENLRSLPSSIGRLKLLETLNLNGCPNLVIEDMDGVTASNLWCLSSLKKLDLSENNMRHIPAAITQLLNLKSLNICHCKMLEEIPELPPRLRKIDIHHCPSLGTLSINTSTLLWSSLLKWFKKIEPRVRMEFVDRPWKYLHEWRKINLGIYGIPSGWVQYQDVGIKIRIDLPMNWYQDDHFLGFGFFIVHQPGLDGDVIYLDLCFDEQYSFQDDLRLPVCEYHGTHGSRSDEVVLVYFPKIAIPDKYHSNQYVLFGANGKFSSYGIHLIYSELDHQRNHNWSLDDDDEDNHMPKLELNRPENSGDNISSTSQHLKRKRDDAEHNQAKEPDHKRYLREPNTGLKLYTQ